MKRLIASIAAVLGSVTPAVATGTFEEHTELFNSVQRVGVKVTINDPKHCTGSIDGMYSSSNQSLVICQDRGRRGGPEVDWTANDLDTLRHEAMHVLQDCADGRRGDGRLVTWHPTERQTVEFAYNTLGRGRVNEIMNFDSYRNAPHHVKIIEMEAFATAATVSPTRISDALLNTCRQ